MTNTTETKTVAQIKLGIDTDLNSMARRLNFILGRVCKQAGKESGDLGYNSTTLLLIGWLRGDIECMKYLIGNAESFLSALHVNALNRWDRLLNSASVRITAK